MNISKYILLLVVFLSSFGCIDYLREEPLTDISIEYLYNTPDGLKAGIAGLYSLNRDIYHIWPNESSKPLWTYVQNDLVIPAAGYIS